VKLSYRRDVVIPYRDERRKHHAGATWNSRQHNGVAEVVTLANKWREVSTS